MSETLPRVHPATTYLDWSNRTLIEISGSDAKSFLHRFCTNDVDCLQTGEGCEAFITTVQGKTLGHVLVSVHERAVVLETVPDQAAVVMPHLDRYLFNERAELINRSEEWTEALLIGDAWEQRFPGLPQQVGHSVARQLGEFNVTLVAAPFVIGPCYALRYEIGAHTEVMAALKQHAGDPVPYAQFELWRICSGFPWYGRDFGDGNLPQELDRNQAAISFTKGCYLGQETIARLDALGHVNKLLKGLKFQPGAGVEAGAEVTCNGQAVGNITSVAEENGTAFAMGIVRSTTAEQGTKIETNGRAGTVCDFPM